MKKCEADGCRQQVYDHQERALCVRVKMAWGDDDGGDKKKGCFKCGEEDPGDLRAQGRNR